MHQLLETPVSRANQQAEFDAAIPPTVLIGLGGTGGDVLLRVRRKIFERYGHPSNFPVVQFLYIDTDTKNQHIDNALLNQFDFNPSERIDATVPDTAKFTRHLNQHPHIKAWWPPTLHDLSQINEGAGQIRAYSRLAFYVNFSTIRNALQRAIAEARASTDFMYRRYGIEVPGDRGVNCYIVASVAGGTGSGMFLDTAFLCRELDPEHRTVGFLVLPGIFLQNQEKIFANTYAAFKELEHFTFPGEGFNYEWALGYPPASKRPLPPPPFNICYLVDSMNAAGQTLNFDTRNSMFELLANNIFQDFGSSDFAGHKRGVRVNLDIFLNNIYYAPIRDPQNPSRNLLAEAFTTRHSAFGLATLSYPADRIKLACRARLASDIMQRLASGKVALEGFTDSVRKGFMRNEVSLYVGDVAGDGGMHLRHDILNALYAGATPGTTLETEIHHWAANLRNEVKNGTYKQRNQKIGEFLRSKIEEENVLFRSEKYDPHWLNWGQYPRALRQNRDAFLATEILGSRDADLRPVPSRLDVAVEKMVNDATKGIQHARTTLFEVRRILTDDAFPYLPQFRREAEELTRRVTSLQQDFEGKLNELLSIENERGIMARVFKKVDIEDLTVRIIQAAEDYFTSLLKLRARHEAIEICQLAVVHIGQDERVIDPKKDLREEATGLIRRLLDLERALNNLQIEFDRLAAEYAKPLTDILTLSVYEPKQIDTLYYPRYLSNDPAERNRRITENAQRMLENLPSLIHRDRPGLTVMQLPVFVANHGENTAVSLILEQTGRAFATLDNDFEVLELFMDRYKDDAERVGQLRLLVDKAQTWMRHASASNFPMGAEQYFCIVGMYDDPSKPNVYGAFKGLLNNKVQKPSQPKMTIYGLRSKSEVVFYTEAAGYPLSHLDASHRMQVVYDRFILEKYQNLHTDRNEFRFRDILPLTENQRDRLEQATDAFLAGIILDIIKPEFDGEDYVFHVEERVGLEIERQSLGTEVRARRGLVRDETLLNRVLSVVRRREDEVVQAGKLPALYAILSFYQSKLYPPERFTSHAKETREQATTENIALRKRLIGVEQRYKGLHKDPTELVDQARAAREAWAQTVVNPESRFPVLKNDWKRPGYLEM